MDSWKCSNCEQQMTVDSFREQGGVNDSYVLIYKCNNCKLQGYTATKNTKDINGAKVIQVMDKEVYTEKQINDVITKLNKGKK